MKTITLKTLCLFSTVILTSPCQAEFFDHNCLHLQVTIKNNTANTCYLLTESTVSGYTFQGFDQELPFKIEPNQQTEPLDIRAAGALTPTTIELTYECGEGYQIKLVSQKNACGNNNTVTTTVPHAENLTATAITSPASYWSNHPAKIAWTIN